MGYIWTAIFHLYNFSQREIKVLVLGLFFISYIFQTSFLLSSKKFYIANAWVLSAFKHHYQKRFCFVLFFQMSRHFVMSVSRLHTSARVVVSFFLKFFWVVFLFRFFVIIPTLIVPEFHNTLLMMDCLFLMLVAFVVFPF